MLSTNIIFLCFVFIGAMFCEYLCIVKFIKMFLKHKVFDIFLQIVSPIVLVSLFFFTNLNVNMGTIRIYTFIAFIIGFMLYKLTFYKILDSFHKLIYNKLTKLKSLKYTKIGKIITK